MTKTRASSQADAAVLIFKTKMTHQGMTDAELRLVVKTVREMVAERQRERAAKKHQATR